MDGIHYLSHMTQDTWENTVSEVRKQLSADERQEWTEDHARSLVYGLLPDNAKEFGQLLWEKASHC